MSDASSRGWGPGWPNCNGSAQVTINITGGAAFPIRREIAELTRVLCEATVARGYAIRKADTWGYNCRPIGGTNSPSNHSWGLAVDINWQTNPHKDPPLVTDMPSWMVDMWQACGFRWGGTYSRPDSMHYEYMGTPGSVAGDLAKAKNFLTPQPAPPNTSKMKRSGGLFQLWREMPDGHIYVSNGINIRWLEKQWDIDNMKNMMKQCGFDTTVYDTTQATIEAQSMGVFVGKKPPW